MARAGRKRKIDIARQPNGQPARRRTTAPDQAGKSAVPENGVLMRRKRLIAALADLASADKPANRPARRDIRLDDERLATTHGALMLAGRLDDDQYQAAEWYLALRGRYLVALGIAQPATGEASTEWRDDDSHARWCVAMVAAFDACKALLKAPHPGFTATPFDALETIVARQSLLVHLVPLVVIALIRLDRAYLHPDRPLS